MLLTGQLDATGKVWAKVKGTKLHNAQAQNAR